MWCSTSRRALARLAAALVAAAALAGCAIGAGKTPTGVRLTITRDFGARTLAETDSPRLSGADTVMRLLTRNARITTRYGGNFVDSIDGLGAGRSGGRPFDWFYYVNGIEASEGAAASRVHDGDRVWWDRHDWGTAMRVPAVVGSFPEPFRHGSGGKRLPVRLECADPGGAACALVSQRLEGAGVPVFRAAPGAVSGSDTLRVLVGPWSALRTDAGAARLGRAPAVSGVYARFAPGGARLSLLDARGYTVRTLFAGAGLVAATRVGDGEPTWFVTGTDEPGALSAARALEEGALAHRFALAVADDRGIALPVAPQ